MKERYAHAFNKILGKVLVYVAAVEELRLSSRKASSWPASLIRALPTTVSIQTNGNRLRFGQWANRSWVIPRTYSGLGAYIKITKLAGPEERVFVEYHLVFDEPYGWFKGEPNLVAHLDEVYPKDVRKFRRDMLNVAQQIAAGAKADDKGKK